MLCGHLLQDPRQCGVVNVTHVLEEVVDDVVVDAAKQVRDPKTFRGVIAGGEHVVFGPRVWHHARFIGFREVRMLVNVGAQEHHGHGQAGTELQDDKAQRHRAKRHAGDLPREHHHEGDVGQFEEHHFDHFLLGIGSVVHAANSLRHHIFEVAVKHPSEGENGVNQWHVEPLEPVHGPMLVSGVNLDDLGLLDVGVVAHDVGEDVVSPHVAFFPVVRAQPQEVEDMHGPTVPCAVLEEGVVHGIVADVEPQEYPPKSEKSVAPPKHVGVGCVEYEPEGREVACHEDRDLEVHEPVAVVGFAPSLEIGIHLGTQVCVKVVVFRREGDFHVIGGHG